MSKMLVVVDMQNDFVDGVLGTKEAKDIIPKVLERIKEYEKDDDNVVVYTMDTHSSINYDDTIEGKHLPIPHCIFGTEGWDFIPEIKKVLNNKREKTYVVYKQTFGYDWRHFTDKDLIYCIDTKKLEHIEIIGLDTDFCVIANAFGLKTIFPNVPIYINFKCCAGSTPEWHEKALTMMMHCHFDII